MKITTILRIVVCTVFFAVAGTAVAAPSPQQVLQYIDDTRAPGADFVFSVEATLVEKPESITNIFDVRVRDSKKSLVLYREPIKQRGRVLLMDGPDMWIFIPGTSRSLRISPQQQLVGGVSHADVARVVFSLDYTAKALEVIDDNKGEKTLKLTLQAIARSTSYQSLILYSTLDYKPTKAEFFSLSGKLLRTAYFERYQTLLGKSRPTSIRMVSAISKAENVRLDYSNIELKETPQSFYQPSYLNQIR